MDGVITVGIMVGHTTKVSLMEFWLLMEVDLNQILEEFHMVTEEVEGLEQGCPLFMEIEELVQEFIVLLEKP